MRFAFLAVLLAALAAAQPFGITAQVGPASVTVAPGGTLTVAAPAIGVATQIRISVSYRGSSTAKITGVDRTGTGDFTSTPVATPLDLTPSSSLNTNITFTPSTGQPVQAVLAVTYIENPDRVPVPSPSTFVVNINGTAPDLVHTYAFSGGNAQAIADGGTIQFPTTAVDATRSATFTILNRGSAPAAVSSILLSGPAFQLGGLQVPPYTINANGSLSFTVTFAPTDRAPQTGKVAINFAGRDYTFNLQGTGTAAAYAYTVLKPDNSTAAVQAGQNIAFPDTNVGATSPVTIQVVNNGNGPGVVNSISVLGNGYQLSALPFLPVTIPIGGQIAFTLTFAPATPGALPGGLKIGDDTFTLTGTGIGPQLTYSYAIGAATTTINSGNPVQFAPSKVGDTGTLTFTVANTGNAATAINTMFLTGSSAFTLANLPALPLNLGPSGSVSFTVRFVPASVGVSQGTLQIGSAIFPVSGSASAPEPLPGVQFTGPTGNIQPVQQPVFTLSLRQPYSIDLAGKLTLTFNSAVFATDPAVQFASGGRIADFIIPAGTSSALFQNNSPQIAIQTGTVAGTITLAATFATLNGVDLTPSSVPNVNLTVPQLAPQITGLAVSNQTSGGFTVNITGYATSRSVTQIGLQITPAAGLNLTNASLTIPVDSTFQAWYQSAASNAAGSAFTAALPLTFSSTSTLTKAIQSIAVTLTNAQGTSQSQSVTIP